MARRLILPLILLVVLAGLLAYVGGQRGILFEFLPEQPPTGDFISLQAAIVGGAAIILSIVALSALVFWVRRLPNRMLKGMGRRRGEQGLDAVEQALLAIESGDGAKALKRAKKASDLLDRPSLTALISAKAAEIGGEYDDAHIHYTELKNNPDTQAAGLHGLARLAENRGDHVASIEMAKASFENSKSPMWTFDLLYTSQVAVSDWAGALETLAVAEKRKLLGKKEIRRRRSVLLSASAHALEASDQQSGALEQAKRAAELSPGFAPGVALAARLLAQDKQTKKAAQIIEKAWAKSPHPALALAYRDLWQGETAKNIATKINALIKTNADHRESKILAAEQALSNSDGVAALSTLDGLLQGDNASARLCTLAAQAENMLGNAVGAKTWQHRAASAPIEADWSDLDPDGTAFNYTDADWQRLSLSYGENGTLIHPRYEAHKRCRVVAEFAPAPREDGLQAEDAPSPDNPGVDETATDSQDLSERLDKLLDDSP